MLQVLVQGMQLLVYLSKLVLKKADAVAVACTNLLSMLGKELRLTAMKLLQLVDNRQS